MLREAQSPPHPLQSFPTTSMPPSSTNQFFLPSTIDSSFPPTTTSNSPKSNEPHASTQKLPSNSAKREIASKTLTTWTYPPSPTNPLPPNRLSPTTRWIERSPDSSPCPSPSLKPTEPQSPQDPYKYDTPDSLGAPAVSRKRKRHRQMHEQMAWNEGLRLWVERRDAWTGALPQSPYQIDGTLPPPSPSPFHPSSPHQHPRPPTPPPPLLPLAPPLLSPTNPIRASISPATYPAIYSKVVVQGLSPTVPINLKDIVGAIVGGWKADGEWPPKGDGGVDGAGKVGKVKRGLRRVLGGLVGDGGVRDGGGG